ncbi:MAG: DUF6875 domain-containing protein, partial [Verrucomicrobiota bacterium]
ITACVEWASTFPRQRVRKHRRLEAICPMVGPSLEDRSFYFAAAFLEEREPKLEALDEILRNAASRFEAEIKESDPRLRCLTLILPGVRGARLLEATDPAREIKGELLKRGILVGEFFPSCPFATTFNPKLFALRSPAPMYVLRTFIEGDWRFICQIPEWQQIYRQRFGEPPRRLRHLGGRWWRLMQKLRWRIDALRIRITPGVPGDLFPES